MTTIARGLVVILLGLTTLTSCLKEGTNRKASGGSSSFNSETTPVRWSTASLNGGLDVQISSDISNTFVGADNDSSGRNPIEQMFNNWNQASSLTFFKVPANTTTNKDTGDLNSYKSDGVLGIYRSDNWFSNVSSQALAITQYFGYRRNEGTSSEYVELFHADILLNYRDYNFSTDSTSGTYDLASVILHELGHFVGLGHVKTYSTASVMQAYLGMSDEVRNLFSHDRSSVQSLYGINALSAAPSGFQAITSASTTSDDRIIEGPKELPSSARELDNGQIHGVIELRADGECRHYLNGELHYTHND